MVATGEWGEADRHSGIDRTALRLHTVHSDRLRGASDLAKAKAFAFEMASNQPVNGLCAHDRSCFGQLAESGGYVSRLTNHRDADLGDHLRDCRPRVDSDPGT